MGFYQRMKFPTFLHPIHQKGHFPSHLIRRSLVLNNGLLKQNHDDNFFQNWSKRCYSVSKPKVDSIRPPGFVDWLKNMFDPSWETIPFTKRKHFVLTSRKTEACMSKESITKSKPGMIKGRIMPSSDPVSVRVRGIGLSIIDCLEKELNKEQVLSSLDAALKAISKKAVSGENGRKGDEVVDDKSEPGSVGRVKGNRMYHKGIPSRYTCLVPRRKGRGRGHSRPTFMLGSNRKGKRRSKIASEDLERLNWELVVVRNREVNNAASGPFGKIVVFTGLLNHCRSDAEIAATIAHEVGHAVARHIAEKDTNYLGLGMMLLVLYPFVTPYFAVLIPTFLLKQHFRRRNEFEADYIGMMLMASAGYDPNTAITVYAKGAEQESWIERILSLISSHPSSTKRARMLTRAEVMDEALLRFRGRPARKREER